MYPTLLDLDTGLTHTLLEQDASVSQWSENNHSCDCNRSLFVGRHLGLDEDAVTRFAAETEETCVARRFVMVDAHGDLEGQAVEDIVRRANADYPGTAQNGAWAWRRAQDAQAEKQVLLAALDEEALPSSGRRPRL